MINSMHRQSGLKESDFRVPGLGKFRAASLSPARWLADPETRDYVRKRVATSVSPRPECEGSRWFHVGELEIPVAGRLMDSFEGVGLSTCEEPDVWSAILDRPPYPSWRLRPQGPGARIFKMENLTDSLVGEAVAAGYLGRSPGFHVTYMFIDQVATERLSELADQLGVPQALRQRQAAGEAGWAVWNREEPAVEISNLLDSVGLPNCCGPVEWYVPGCRLSERWHQFFDTAPAQVLLPELAAAMLLNDRGAAEGVWWNDFSSPALLSSPRGLVFEESLRQGRFVLEVRHPDDNALLADLVGGYPEDLPRYHGCYQPASCGVGSARPLANEARGR